QAEDGIRDLYVTGVQTCALPILAGQTVTITQAANSCVYNLSTTSSWCRCPLTGCRSWTAVSNVPWITITGGASGTGIGTVTYSRSEERRVGKEWRSRGDE